MNMRCLPAKSLVNVETRRDTRFSWHPVFQVCDQLQEDRIHPGGARGRHRSAVSRLALDRRFQGHYRLLESPAPRPGLRGFETVLGCGLTLSSVRSSQGAGCLQCLLSRNDDIRLNPRAFPVGATHGIHGAAHR